MSIWTDAVVAFLKALYVEGYSYSEISQKLSVSFRRKISRSAVAGKVDRLGLSKKAAA